MKVYENYFADVRVENSMTAYKCTVPLHRTQMCALIGGNLVNSVQKVIQEQF